MSFLSTSLLCEIPSVICVKRPRHFVTSLQGVQRPHPLGTPSWCSTPPSLRDTPSWKEGELFTLPLLKGEYGEAGRELSEVK